MNEKTPAQRMLNYAVPEKPLPRSLWPPIILVLIGGGVMPLLWVYAFLMGLASDSFWGMGLSILLTGVFSFAIRNDRRGMLMCLVAFLLILGIALALPSIDLSRWRKLWVSP